jgi:hypothetical protein
MEHQRILESLAYDTFLLVPRLHLYALDVYIDQKENLQESDRGIKCRLLRFVLDHGRLAWADVVLHLIRVLPCRTDLLDRCVAAIQEKTQKADTIEQIYPCVGRLLDLQRRLPKLFDLLRLFG